jgi:hypothetical protein
VPPPRDIEVPLDNRCAISVNSTFLQMITPGSRLLLTNLHIRMQPASSSSPPAQEAVPLLSVRGGELWGQDLHLRGPGVATSVPSARGIDVANAGALQLAGEPFQSLVCPSMHVPRVVPYHPPPRPTCTWFNDAQDVQQHCLQRRRRPDKDPYRPLQSKSNWQ